MRRMLFILLILLTSSDGANADLRIGDTLPPVLLPVVTGTPVRIPENFRGKVILLHFWQIGCSSCKLEMPAMDRLYGSYRRKGLEILAVNVGQKKETVKTFVAEMGVSYTILLDTDGKSKALYGVKDVPRTYLIDRSGVVRYRILGGATPEMLKKLILSLL